MKTDEKVMFSAGSAILVVDQFGVFFGYLDSQWCRGTCMYASIHQLLILIVQCLYLQSLCSQGKLLLEMTSQLL